jgi:hypothetical protein
MDDIRENEPTARDIERRAYGFYLLRGMADGKDVEEWINRQVKIGAPMVHVGNETDLCEVLYQCS